MRYVRAPEEFPGGLSGAGGADVSGGAGGVDGPAVFLAGGFTNVGDWQEYARGYLERAADFPVTVFNPRRDDFDLADTAATVQQIGWEHRMLRRADLVLFWFAPGPSVQPITLFELGSAAEREGRIVVGADETYARRTDVCEQLRLVRPEVRVHKELDAVLGEAVAVLRTLWEQRAS